MTNKELLKVLKIENSNFSSQFGGDVQCSCCRKYYDYGTTPMIKNRLWTRIYSNLNGHERWLLCKDCMEKDLGRKIRISDTTLVPLNFGFVITYKGNTTESEMEKKVLEYHNKWRGEIEGD